MGRSKTSAKQKSNVPILFPHDGPVFRRLSSETTSSDGPPERVDDDSLERAVTILGGARDSGSSSSNNNSNRNALLVFNLCQSLQQTNTTTKAQLQALQSFKCTFLNLAKEADKLSEEESALQHGDNDDSSHLIGLYRLLLEWSLSYRTPLPFQRAIQANLKMLGSSSTIFATTNAAMTVCKDAVESIWKTPEKWQNPMHSLDVVVNYSPLREILQADDKLFVDCLAFLGRSQTVSIVMEKSSSSSSQVMDDALRIVTMLKILLGGMEKNSSSTATTTTTTTNTILPLLEKFEKFVFALLIDPNLPSDGFNTLGILYGKLLFFSIASETKVIQTTCTATVAALDSNAQQFRGLSPLASLSMVQGMAATLDANVLMTTGGMDDSENNIEIDDNNNNNNENHFSPLEVCWEYSLRVGQTSTDPLVRWASIKGLSTLASRWKQNQAKMIKEGNDTNQQPQQQELFQHSDLIQKTLDLVFDSWENPPLRKLGTAIPGLFKALVQLLPKNDLRGLCHQVLQQPASRKGRYLALEILLPYMPATTTSAQTTDPSLAMAMPMESMLEGIGDRGSNAGSIANLWIKILKRAWEEISSKNSSVEGIDTKESSIESWKEYWMPSFCRTILDPSLNRRKQVMAFCLPRIADLMKEFDSLKDQLPLVFVGLLKGIEGHSEASSVQNTGTLEDGFSDRVLWAELETARYSSVMKVSSEKLKGVLASCLHKQKFRFALVHSLPFIRIVAFRAMKCVVSSYGITNELEEQVAMWRYALPYSIKTNESKEYLSNFLQCLANFLDRLSAWEAGTNDADSSECDSLPIFHSFVIDFLINDMVLDKGSYPGTIADKEVFAVSLLDCLLAFALQDESYGEENTTMKKNAVFNRKRLPNEEVTMTEILRALVRRDVLSSLFALLHSIWDGTRAVTFKYLTKLVVASQSRQVALAKEYSDENERKSILARGIYLASSPRQRESDTGARMLGFLYASTPGRAEKDLFLGRIVNLSMDRVSSMKYTLNDILMGNSASTDGSCLPLAHGLVHATRLCIKHDESERRLLSMTSKETNVNLNESMIDVFCKALQLSLSVVADIRDGETIDGIDEETLFATNSAQEADSTPLNVNTGAIGANGTFSSVSATDTEEAKARLAMQRVVVGSWLLTKETCAAIASVITTEGYVATHILVSKVGQLLLSTLTTLKHAGAAFAARDALQQIAANCLNTKNPSNIRSLPDLWSHRLIDEISLNEKVRNSTLRRSTGYALGFLAIMRADVGNKSDSSIMSTPLLQQLLMLSLPPEQRIEESLAKLKIGDNEADRRKMFVYAHAPDLNQHYVLDSQYEARCRVHALNILRMIILDAPLASAISPFVGDAVISAILGYDDPSWAIRNSSTMVFAAAMLRVVDSDKNASNSDKTSSNAITLTELFRRYPPLATFIPSVLRICLEEMESKGNVKSEMFPLLLMLSRVQPVLDSSTKVSDDFVPLLFRCLGSKDHGIRHAAARSLANLSSKATGPTLLSDCKQHIKQILGNETPDWNLLDGILLVMDSLGLSMNKGLFDPETQNNLFGIVNLSRVPPSCRSTALEILLASPFVDNNTLIQTCEKISQNDSIQFMIGGCLLYKAASEGLCRMFQKSLWPATSESTLEQALSQLKTIFVSDVIDVRLYAVKSFKKAIYDNLDRLRIEKTDGITTIPTNIILYELATMLLNCVAVELRRGIAETTGSHTPTLRRLSRCFLETVDAAPKCLLSLDQELIWSISHEITEREYSVLAEGAESTTTINGINYLECSGGNVLSSNAVEMMSVAIAIGQAASTIRDNEGESCQTYDRMKILLRVVNSLNDPNGSWRSRYSAALALKTCCDTLSGVEEDNFGQEILRRKIQRTILEMLQDSDPDVRTVAVRAATKFYATKDNDSGFSSIHHLLLPEWTLERTFPSTFAVDASSRGRKEQQCSTMEILLGMVLDHCQGLIDDTLNVQNEFSHTNRYCHRKEIGNDDDDTADLKRLVNVNTTRKIFEDEDPNPFQEKNLLNQLAVQSILNLTKRNSLTIDLTSSKLDFPLANNIQDAFTMCDSVLAILLKTQKAGGIIHELSRFPTIFPSLHSLLCVSAASIYLMKFSGNEVDTADLQMLMQLRAKLKKSAQKLESMDESHQYLQPDIVRALQVLGQSQEIKCEDVEDLLFLLKHAEKGSNRKHYTFR